MINIHFRTREDAERYNSPYTITVFSGSNPYTAYKNFTDFIKVWKFLINDDFKVYTSNDGLSLSADLFIRNIYYYDKSELPSYAFPVDLLSNGYMQKGAVFYDKKKKTITFYRLDPNSKNYIM